MALAKLFGKKTTQLTDEVDLGSTAFFQDPYPTYELLRNNQPVAAVKPAGHLLTRHGDILSALASKDLRNAPSRFSVLNKKNADRYEAARLANNILPFIDPPGNTIRRQCLIRSVRAQLDIWQPSLEGVAARQMELFLQGDSEDVIEKYASPLSLNLMCDFIGFENPARNHYKDLSDAFFYLFAPLSDAEKFEQVNNRLARFRSELHQLLELRRANPKADLISKLISAEHENEGLSEDEIIDSCMLVFADGVENVEAGVANVVAAFYQDRDAQEMFHSNEMSLEQLVSEGLRLQTPAQFVPRIACRDMEISGVEIAAETPVFLSLASGNRDTEVFEAAEKMLSGRSAQDLLTFGRGAHSCIGSRLASLQIGAAVKHVIGFGLTPKIPLSKIRFKSRLAHRWPTHYPMTKP